MSTFDVFFDFLSCSIFFGIAKLPTMFKKLSDVMQKQIPKKLNRHGVFVTILSLLMALMFSYTSYRRGTLNYLDLAATVASGYFFAYFYFFRITGNLILALLHLIIPVFLLLAVLFNSIGWAIAAAIVFLIWFKLKRELISGLGKFVHIRQEIDKHAMDNLMKDVMAINEKMDDETMEWLMSLKRRDIFVIVAETIACEADACKIRQAAEITEEMFLQKDLGLCAPDLQSLRRVWEQIFNVEIDDCEIAEGQITTIKDVVDMLESKIC